MKYVVGPIKKYSRGYCIACNDDCANDCIKQTGCSKLLDSIGK